MTVAYTCREDGFSLDDLSLTKGGKDGVARRRTTFYCGFFEA